MSPKADVTDSTSDESFDLLQRQQHARRVLAHLQAQQEAAAQQDGATDITTELSALMDTYVVLRRLDRPSQSRVLNWLEQKLDDEADGDTPLRF